MSNSYFNGKVALVTGGAGGIGFSIIQKLLENGIKGVAIVDISEKHGLDVEKALQEKFPNKTVFIKTDVSNHKELEAAFEKTIEIFKNLDIVVNNAGILEEKHWRKTISVNLEAVIDGTFLAKDKYLPKYMSSDEGIIMNTASILGLLGVSSALTYCATKHGVIGLGKALAAQHLSSTHNLKVITICPGLIATPILEVCKDIDRNSAINNVDPELLSLSEKMSSPDYVGDSVVKLMIEAKHGSIWIIQNEEAPYEVQFPDKTNLKKYCNY